MLSGIFLFLFGLAFGSFLNAFLYRFENKISQSGRSFCPNCKNQIAWYDNIPLLSWLILGGKCRSCHKAISIRYPLVELMAGLMFLGIGLFGKEFGGNWLTNQPLLALDPISFDIIFIMLVLLTFSALLSIALYDIKTKEIPNGFNLIFIALAALNILSMRTDSLLPNLISGAIAFIFFYSFVYFSKETWMGGGDAKLSFGIGLLLGPVGTFIAILIASWLGAIYGVGVILLQRLTSSKKSKYTFRSEIPFGPFLALGCYISYLFGSQIFDWYARIFLRI